MMPMAIPFPPPEEPPELDPDARVGEALDVGTLVVGGPEGAPMFIPPVIGAAVLTVGVLVVVMTLGGLGDGVDDAGRTHSKMTPFGGGTNPERQTHVYLCVAMHHVCVCVCVCVCVWRGGVTLE